MFQALDYLSFVHFFFFFFFFFLSFLIIAKFHGHLFCVVTTYEDYNYLFLPMLYILFTLLVGYCRSEFLDFSFGFHFLCNFYLQRKGSNILKEIAINCYIDLSGKTRVDFTLSDYEIGIFSNNFLWNFSSMFQKYDNFVCIWTRKFLVARYLELVGILQIYSGLLFYWNWYCTYHIFYHLK